MQVRAHDDKINKSKISFGLSVSPRRHAETYLDYQNY